VIGRRNATCVWRGRVRRFIEFRPRHASNVAGSHNAFGGNYRIYQLTSWISSGCYVRNKIARTVSLIFTFILYVRFHLLQNTIYQWEKPRVFPLKLFLPFICLIGFSIGRTNKRSVTKTLNWRIDFFFHDLIESFGSRAWCRFVWMKFSSLVNILVFDIYSLL